MKTNLSKFKGSKETFSVFIRENKGRYFLAEDEGEWIKIFDLPKLENDEGRILCHELGKFWEFMPGHDSSYNSFDLPHLINKENIQDHRITIFAGSFNPWHLGHQACLEQCPEENVLVIPDYSPWKERQQVDCFWKSFRSLCLGMKNFSCSFYSGFYGHEMRNPTVDWLPFILLKEKSLLMGEDTFLGLAKWKNIKELLEALQRIYIVPRKVNGIIENFDEVMSELQPFKSFQFLEGHNFEDFSSTKIRGPKN